MKRTLLCLLCFLLLSTGVLSLPPISAQAQVYTPIKPAQLEAEINEFFAAGAQGYLVWQYSGDRGGGQEFANDKYSFFRNQPEGQAICNVLSQAATSGSGKFVGVNMWDVGDPKHSQAKLEDHFAYLKNDCGVTVIRIFAKAGEGPGVKKALNAAAATGVRLIVALGDYSNGGGGVPKGAGASWYADGYTGEYQTFVNTVVSTVGPNPAGLYGYELANEPHCGGDLGALPAYKNWVKNMSQKLQGVAPNVGIGQMAGHNTSLCDSPGPGHFAETNNVASISMSSAHYYNSDEKTNALAALAQNPGKLFYIGEAGWGGKEDEPEDYYLYPIQGLPSPLNPAGDQTAIFNDLITQGYETQCSTPTFNIEAVGGGKINRLKELVEQGRAGVQPRNVDADLTIDYINSTVPVWRDSNPISTLMSSLEDFWGYQEVNEVSNADQLIASSPIYGLLSTTQQCQAKVGILESIESLCAKLADPSTCALYQPIPGSTEYTTRTTLDEWRNTGLSCDQVGEGEYTAAQKPLINAVMRTPLYLDRAYRLAFLVITTKLNEDPSRSNFFDFLRRVGGNADPQDEVRVIAFKIPDIGTNRAEGETSYQDPLQLTRNALLDSNQINENTEVGRAEREARRVITPPGPGSVIKCGGDSCTDPLTRSLVQMVNNQGLKCEPTPEDLEYEPSGEISSPGELVSGPGTLFNDETDPAKSLFTAPADQVTQPQVARFNFLAALNLGGEGESKAQTQAFLIYPMGYELSRVEDTLLTFFEREWGSEFKSNQNIPDFFKLGGIDQNLVGGKATAPFFDPARTACSIDPITGAPVCTDVAEAELKATLTDKEPRILGARLGYLSRFIQQTMHKIATAPLDFLASCKTTEDFLLGRCEGANTGDDTTTDPTDTLTAVARCAPGSKRFTTGEGATHIQSETNPACNTYVESVHGIPNWRNPNDPVKPCSELFSPVACVYSDTLIQNPVTAAGQFSSSGVTACEYVVSQARSRGVSPRFALAMWGEESGFSSYRVPDFGVTSQPAQNLSAQLNSFLGTADNFAANNYLSFLEQYAADTDGEFCRNPVFPGRVREFYDFLGP